MARKKKDVALLQTARAATCVARFAPLAKLAPHPDPLPASGERERESRASGKKDSAARSALYRLMAWLSPAYPVGAFSYSSGIEWAVEAGDIKDAESLRRWLAVVIGEGGVFCDAVFLVHAHRAIAGGDDKALHDGRRAGRRVRAVQGAPSRNHRAGPRLRRGDARRLAVRRARPPDRNLGRPGRLSRRGRRRGRRTRHRARSGAQRLSSCRHRQSDLGRACGSFRSGQTEGQRLLAALEPVAAATAQRALATSLDDVGGAAFRADIASMKHETQYTRLFRT